ncbi:MULTISPECIES: Mpo1 family 2-hydroxy fatty acid dioxygenase [Bacteroidota]|jgi:uncharacterized membrane protein YGL010W|uniref:DUF962 domain-containing protein n=2 Tax=Flectobacillus TaxID=101 RepID=A0ABT6YYQ9_9BACT|nr:MULTISPECIES: Mpo1-like protein [Bacteroidota]MDI9873549.1 DUF962 domain-containing protein [Flectobacillus rivi]NBB31332.1 DUF962 domain-containing protein [Cellulophaga sp. BC115SP]
MKTIYQWLSEYGESHQNATNKAVHSICVPLIFFSIVGFFFSVKLPFFNVLGIEGNLAMLMLTFTTFYYFVLSKSLSIGMFVFSLICLLLCLAIESSGIAPLWQFCSTIFIFAWIGQFWGHKVEGRKPSFFKDLQFLMIGPAWLLSFIYQRFGITF